MANVKTDNRYKLVEATLRRYGYSANALIEGLHTVQEAWGYLAPDGRWAIPARFERAGVFRNGLAAAKEPGQPWGFLKPDGSWGIEPKLSRVRSFSDGLAAVSGAGQAEPGPEPETGGIWP